MSIRSGKFGQNNKMATAVCDKLRIKAGNKLFTLNAPATFKKDLGKLPPDVLFCDNGKGTDQVHWFVKNQAQLKKELSKLMRMLQTGMTVWIYYPKGSSKIQTDLTRDKGWDCLKAEEDKLTWLNLISLNETWSAFGFRVKTEADKKKESKPAVEREIFKWANSATKEIILPPDLATAFKKHKKEAAYFHSLAFSHKREYVEWIVTAKKEETRAKRIEGTIERLMLQWKNPRDQ